MSSSISRPSMVGKVARCSACQRFRKSVMMRSSRWTGSGSVFTATRNSVVPIRNVATLSGPRETENLISCPRALICGSAQRRRLSMKGRSPSVAGSGTCRSAICATSVMILSANGNSLAGNWHREPKAEGSVHMPNSDQKPGRNQMSGNVASARLWASSQWVSLARYSAMVTPCQLGSQGQSMMKPTGSGRTASPRTTASNCCHWGSVMGCASKRAQLAGAGNRKDWAFLAICTAGPAQSRLRARRQMRALAPCHSFRRIGSAAGWPGWDHWASIMRASTPACRAPS